MERIFSDPITGGYIAAALGLATLTGLVGSQAIEGFSNIETFENQNPQIKALGMTRRGPTQSNNIYAGPNIEKPSNKLDINLNTSGDQMLAYQLYQQAINAATPTQQQLDSISGESQQQTGAGAVTLGGGLSENTAPYDTLYGSEYQAVNYGNNERAQSISACAQNAPTFVATSLLPKPEIPGEKSWDINAPNNILANQNFLSATQQIGVDTVLGSLRNPSYDIRNNIPNPINVVSPWNQTTILPDLEKRPLDCVSANTGLYGCPQ